MPEKYAYRERLPQSFPYGFPPSSLEPGTTDQQHPPSYLFPNAPLGEADDLMIETPLQAMEQLREATSNLKKLVGDLSKSPW